MRIWRCQRNPIEGDQVNFWVYDETTLVDPDAERKRLREMPVPLCIKEEEEEKDQFYFRLIESTERMNKIIWGPSDKHPKIACFSIHRDGKIEYEFDDRIQYSEEVLKQIMKKANAAKKTNCIPNQAGSRMSIDQILKQLRDAAVGKSIEETNESSILHLTRNEFQDKMLQEESGQALLDLLEAGEWRICERMGLCDAYIDNETAYIDVPGWNNLVTHLQIVNSV